MKVQQQVLPVKCVRCGATFDLWHDLLVKREQEADEVSTALKQNVCWGCRQVLKSELGKEYFEVSEGEEELLLEMV